MEAKLPIPLRSPDGSVYAYACGQCRHVGGTGTMIRSYDDETVQMMAESSREEAVRCCRCRACGGLVADRWAGFWGPASGYCEACTPAEEERQRVRTEELRAAIDASNASLGQSRCLWCGATEDDA